MSDDFLTKVSAEMDGFGVPIIVVPEPEGRPWKAADISDEDMLRVVHDVCVARDMWASKWCVHTRFPRVPEKVVDAKLGKLLRCRLVTGCDCGCRGDWELTRAGYELLGVEVWRDNPCEGIIDAGLVGPSYPVEVDDHAAGISEDPRR